MAHDPGQLLFICTLGLFVSWCAVPAHCFSFTGQYLDPIGEERSTLVPLKAHFKIAQSFRRSLIGAPLWRWSDDVVFVSLLGSHLILALCSLIGLNLVGNCPIVALFPSFSLSLFVQLCRDRRLLAHTHTHTLECGQSGQIVITAITGCYCCIRFVLMSMWLCLGARSLLF